MTGQGLVRFVDRVGWAALLATIGLTFVAPAVARAPVVQWSPWLLGLAVLGIPHGALDHKVGGELRGLAGAADQTLTGARFYLAYLTAVAVVLATWFLAPVVASVGFLVLAAAHFGQGDVYWSRRFGLAGRSKSVGYRLVLLVTRSLVPIALPLLAFPVEFAGAGTDLAARLFGRSGWSVPSASLGIGMGLLATVIAVQVGWAAWLGVTGGSLARRLAGRDIAETLGLVALFALVPPVLAIGVYFNAWHSLRHVARLLLITAATRDLVASDRILAAFARFGRQSLPMSLGALAIVAGLGLVVGRSVGSIVDLGLVALVALSALTLPHVLVVAWMDARQGIWSG